MKKIILILLLSVSFLFANIGKITGIKGDVIIKRGSQELVPNVGFILEQYDEIITKDKSKVLLLFIDGTSITVGKDSKMKVNEYLKDADVASNNKAKFGFDKGVFKSITGKIGKVNPNGFKLETKSSSLGIRGSEGLSVVKENGDVKHSTLSGGYYMVNKSNGVKVEIPQGTTARFEAGKITVMPTTKADIEEGDELAGDNQEQVVDKGEKQKEEDKKEQAQEEDKKEQAQEEDKKENTSQKEQKDEDGQTGQSDGETKNNIVTDEKTQDEAMPPINPDNKQFDSAGDAGVVQEQPEAPKLVEQPKTPIVETPEVIVPQEAINSKPVLTYNLSQLQENSITTIQLVGVDIDGDKLTYAIISEALYGEVTIDAGTGEIVYIPNENYNGNETLTVQVSDGKGGIDTKVISFEVQSSQITNIQTYTPSGTLEDLMVDLSTVTKEIVGSDTYDNTNVLEYGYILEEDIKKSTYLTGLITPTEVIEQYIVNKQTASYSGNIASFVDGVATNGTINLNMNFGTKNFTGAINVGSDWKANINSGTITSYGFNSTNIGSATNSAVQNISGSLNGKYYGVDASSVGGTLQLNSGTNSVNGVFGANK